MHYIVYRITNNLTNKQYIGVHKTNDLQDGYMGSGLLIKRAIEKYGIENFSKEILFEASSSEEMFDKERELIELHDPEYNLHEGGKGGWDYVNKNGLRRKDIHKNFGTGDKLKQNRKKGKSTLEKKIAEDPEVKQQRFSKLSVIRKGKPGTFLGKQHTEEAKRKIGKANAKRMRGSGNSNYGKVWITNGTESKTILKEEVIPVGWKKGRVIKN